MATTYLKKKKKRELPSFAENIAAAVLHMSLELVDFRHFPQLQNHLEKHFDFENMGLALHHNRQQFQHLDLETQKILKFVVET